MSRGRMKGTTGTDWHGERPPLVRCWCPGCERFHVKRMLWSGRGVPRVRCKECRDMYARTEANFGLLDDLVLTDGVKSGMVRDWSEIEELGSLGDFYGS